MALAFKYVYRSSETKPIIVANVLDHYLLFTSRFPYKKSSEIVLFSTVPHATLTQP